MTAHRHRLALSKTIWIAAAAALLLPACGGADGERATLALGVLDATGGVLEVTDGLYAGARLDVPAGALARPVQLRLVVDTPLFEPGFLANGRALTVHPVGLTFLRPVTVTLPIQNRLGAPNVLLTRGADGAVVEMGPSRSPAQDRVNADVLRAATHWGAEPLFDGVSASSRLPLADGNTWDFGDGLSLSARQSAVEPNFGGASLFVVTITDGNQSLGLYVESPPFQPATLRGQFFVAGTQSVQQVHEALPLVPQRLTLLQEIESAFLFQSFTPLGGTTPGGSGAGTNRLVFTHERSLVTTAGTFTDLVELSLVMRFVDNAGGNARQVPLRLLLATNVGPVAIAVFDRAQTLISAVVGGNPIP